jgi:drug/metabolite transporter (DMT)-like permease
VSATAETRGVALRAEVAPDRVALGSFTGAVLIGGTNFVAIRFSNRGLDAIWGAGLRFTLAAAVFGLLFVALRLSFPRGRTLLLVVVYGVLAFAGAYGCLYWAMKEVPAGIAAVVLAAGPLLTLLLAVGHGMERLSRAGVLGALVAILGSAVIFLQPAGVDFGWRSFAFLIAGAVLASQSVVVSKLVGPQHPVAVSFVGMSAGAVVLVAVAAILGERFVLPADRETQLALVYLVAATVGLFVLALTVVQRWTASATSYMFVLMPVVAIALGALLAGEAIAPTTVLGGAIVCAGVYFGAVRRG